LWYHVSLFKGGDAMPFLTWFFFLVPMNVLMIIGIVYYLRERRRWS